MSEFWWVWIAVATAFVIAEIFTVSFFLLWFGIGAAAAGIAAYFGLSAGWQWAVFVIVSAPLLAASRKFAEKFTKVQPEGVGADRLIGQQAIVIEEINQAKNTGHVRVGSENWRAGCVTNETITAGALVSVTKIEGTRLIVKKLEEEK